MKKDYAILLVDSASFYVKKYGLKSRFIVNEKHDANVEKHDANREKHIVKECIYNDRKIAETYFLNRFCNGEIYFGYIGKKKYKKT